VIGLALAGLRHRAAAFVAVFLAVLLGSALVVACGGLFETAIRLSAQPQRLAGAPLVVTGPAGFKLPDEESETVAYAERSSVPLSAVGEIARVRGVAAAVPDISFPAVLPGESTALAGHAWTSARLTPYELRSGRAPEAGQVVVDTATAARAHVRVGDEVTLLVGGAKHEFRVAGTADGPVTAMFFADSDARRYTPHPDRADVIGVLPAPGTSVEDLAGRMPAGLTVLTGDERGAAEFTGIDGSRLPLILLSAIFGGMVLVVMSLVVWATISLSVRQRQRELALLRATGATPDQARQLVVRETLVVAVLACVGGALLGRFMGAGIFSATTAKGIVPAALEFRQGPVPFAAGAVLGLVVPWLTARLAAGVAARTKPVQALADASLPATTVHPVRRLAALVFAALTVLLAMTTVFFDADTASAVGGPAVLTGAIAVALFGPELVVWLLDRAAPLVRRLSPRAGDLAMLNSRARAAQFAAVLTPLVLASAIALGNVYSQTTMDDEALATSVDQFQADAVLTSSAGGIAPSVLADVQNTRGVTAASALVLSQGWVEEPYDGNGSDPSPFVGISNGDVLATPVSAGSLRNLRGRSVALPADEADDLGVGVGSTVTLRQGDGSRSKVKVVALLDDGPSVVVPADLLAPHTTGGLPTYALVRGDTSALTAAPGVRIGDEDALEDAFAHGLDVQAWINYLLAGLALAYAAIAAINALAVALLSRRRELAAQQLAGSTRREVTSMLLVEAAVVAGAGLALGTVISLFTVLPMAIATGAVIPSGPVWVFFGVAVALFAIVWPVTLVAARVAMRRRPIEAIAQP
jgi:putative ABC transport system permease protein